MKDKKEDTVTALMMTMVIVALMSTVPLMANATDTNGNYNDTVNLTLAVKGTNGAVIPFPGRMPTIWISNLTFDAIIPSPGNIEGHPGSFCMSGTLDLERVDRDSWEFGLYDKQTNWSIDMHADFDHVNEKVILKRLVTGKEGIEVANLAFLTFWPLTQCV